MSPALEHINIQQGAHRLDALLIHQLSHVTPRHHFAARRENRHASLDCLRAFGFFRRRHQPAARQCGNDTSRRAALPLCQFFGGLEHVFLNVESRSHQVMLVDGG